MRRFTLALALAAGSVAVPATAGAATKTVDMGLPLKSQNTFFGRYHSDVNDFFPHGVEIHVGDSVRFVPTQFHTVDFPRRGRGPANLIAPDGKKVSGVSDAAGNPFWFNGRDELNFDPALFQFGYGKRFTYTGARAVRSGLPVINKPKPMIVRFTRTGRFTYFCNVHPGMKGVVTVVGRRRAIPSRKADAAAVKRQVARTEAVAKNLGRTRTSGGIVDVGSAGRFGVERFQFFPGSVTIKAGTTLRFRMSPGSLDVHTATTGPGNPETQPNSYLGKLAASFNGPSLDQQAVYQSEAPGVTAGLSPTLHGNGFWNSGVMMNRRPLPSSASLRFTAPGTYEFFCLIHPFMHGKVIVK